MLDTIKKVGISITIAILFAVFAFSISDLVFPQPEYSDYCDQRQYKPSPVNQECEDRVEAPEEFSRNCTDKDGFIEYDYGDDGCAVDYSCNTCRVPYNEAIENHRLSSFIITSMFGLVAVIAGIVLKPKTELSDWIISGFIIGGLISIFMGTIMYFGDMSRFVRPIVIASEIALVIWVSLKLQRKAEKNKASAKTSATKRSRPKKR